MHSQIFVIAKKDLKEILRDKSTLVIILLSVAIFPLASFFGSFVFSGISQTQDMNITVYYDNPNNETVQHILDYLRSDNCPYFCEQIKSENLSKYDQAYTDSSNFIVCIKNNLIQIVCNKKSFESLRTGTDFSEKFQQYYISVNSEIPILELVDKSNQPITAKSSISFILPCLLIFILLQNDATIATDLFAGEKERCTLQMLIYTGAKRENIYFGKFLVLSATALINLIFSLFSMFFSQRILQTANISITSVFILLAVFMLLLTIFNCISLLISMNSKTIRQAQVINEAITALPIILSVIVIFELIKLPGITRFIPGLSLFYLVRDIYIFGKTDLFTLLFTILSNLFLIFFMINLSIKNVKSEKLLS